MSEPIRSFTRQPLNIDDVVVYLKDGCKFIGQIVGFVNTKVKIRRLSPPNTFVTPEETQDYGEVSVNPDDVVDIIISRWTWVQAWMELLVVMYMENIYSKTKE